jgi:hypothetical protein
VARLMHIEGIPVRRPAVDNKRSQNEKVS